MPSEASAPDSRIPFATSLIVPSPPHAMIKLLPSSAPFAASFAASPLRVVNAQVNAPKCVESSEAIPGQALRVAPPAEVGLTMMRGNEVICVMSDERDAIISSTALYRQPHPAVRTIFYLLRQALRSCSSQNLQSLYTCGRGLSFPRMALAQVVDRSVVESVRRPSSCPKPVAANYCQALR